MTLPILGARTDIRLPAYDPADVRVGIVHLGLGAFHRAHQAVYTDDVLGSDPTWGISAYTQRSARVRDQIGPQHGLFTVLERGNRAGPLRVVGSILEARAPSDGPGAAERIADPTIRLVTLTVTEKGYRFRGGGLDLRDPLIQADLARFGRDRPRTVVGQLAAGLELRRRGDAGPLSILPCDNLPANGATVRRLVRDFCAALPTAVGDPLAAWIDTEVAFPSCVVDRIVPSTAIVDLDEVSRLLGFDDAGAVVSEPFSQWTVEDVFAAGRPAWERAGAVFTTDVAPYEAAKLRLLNAAHSLLAYTGALSGHDTIARAMTDPVLADAARRLMAEDAVPTLTLPDGFDVEDYQRTILLRFADPALGHRTNQVAADGSLKLPIRLLDTARDRLAAGGTPYWVALAVAAWMVYVATRDTVQDPLAARLAMAAAGRDTPSALVDALLAVREVFPEAPDPVWREMLIEHAAKLL
ncbi:mannitol dehydrogenase family protein [Micromonospora sp. LH3U1]|uniref:mannitol dehydrogenase family protein n=1 Tax=Micromonospora sp. LH3U1 TaxID=3018339 RepID=UPI002349AA58|nr:mannitol dehydrogenase family protein [Micromonospora sp. LH3U1]WCN79574.1 mannitol dehydrogenase family protein [Micromonospora sp. LH3U1]